MKNCIHPIVLILLITGNFAFGQDLITLTGKVTDAQTGKPVPFANIYLKGRSIGIAANQNGVFVFKISLQAHDTLIISSVGYNPFQRIVDRSTENLFVKLEPATVQLAEVVVNSQSALDIVKQAVSKFELNYDTGATQLTAFYQENIFLGDFELNHAEAVLDIYKVFKTEKKANDQIRVIKGRKKKIDFGNDGQFYFWISGISNGARGSLLDEMVKHHRRKFNPLNPANHKYYTYDYTEMIKEGARNIMVIRITPKPSKKAILYMNLFIDEESLAIVKYDFSLNDTGVQLVSRRDKGLAYSVMTKLVKATLDYQKFQSTVTFKEYKNKWYLNSIQRHWEIFVNSEKRNMVNEPWTADMDLIITNINTDHVKPITEGNIGNSEAPIANFVGDKYDDAFWEDYNFLKPIQSDSLRVGIDTLPKQQIAKRISNRQNGFTRADTLRGKLTPWRSNYNVTFYHLDIDVDLNEQSVKGNNLIRFQVLQPLSKLQIDLYANMKIEKVLYKEQSLPYTREFDAVYIQFPSTLIAGSKEEVKIYYHGIPQIPDRSIPMNGGVLWDKDSLGNAWAQMVCQGSGASLWWPNKDHLSDEPDSMKIWITVPDAYTEISNGRLINKTSLPDHKTRYEWFVSYPINNYNVTFNIGKYAHYHDTYITQDTLTLDYYIMPYHLDHSKRMFSQVKPMLECFEKNFGKYPFFRDGFTLIESLYPMEHQSGVCFGKINPEQANMPNPLLWHESAHEWWGNAISCTDMADLWIHEAFATYAEALMTEQLGGKPMAQDFLNDQQRQVRNVEPVIGIYDVNHIFYEIGDIYSKGSLMLNTFRNVLNNDTRWVQLLQAIQNQFQYKTVTSQQLIEFINQQTKTDYTYLFDQYLNFTSLPLLQIKTSEKGSNIEIQYRWETDVKSFRMPVKVSTATGRFEFIYPSNEWKTMTIKNMKEHEFEVDEDHFFIDVEFFKQE